MMVARDVEEQACEAESEELVTNGEDQPLSHDSLVFNNAAEEIPEYRKQLLIAKDDMANVADMYQQDYLDKVEQRADLANEARLKAVSCLVDVSKRIYNLAGCFQQLLDDQADKLQEIENMTVTASASFDITSCYNFRTELHSRLPPANIPNRQPRIGRPDSMQTDEFFKENVIWEKLNYNKYDRIGAGLSEFDDFDDNVYTDGTDAADNTVPNSTSQQSLHSSTGSSNKSYVTATSAISPAPPNSNHSVLSSRDPRLSASSIDIRQPKSPALNRYGSTNSLNSLNSSKSDTIKGGTLQSKPVPTVKRTLSSLKLQPSRAAPAPPPAKQNPHRSRVSSVKNETGEGLEKPCIPVPPPPTDDKREDEDHYAVPPSAHVRLPALSEERGTPTPADDAVIYDDVRSKRVPPVSEEPVQPPLPQYQTITVVPPAPPPPDAPDNGYDDDDELYMDLDEIAISDPTTLTTPTTPGPPTDPVTPTTPANDAFLSPSNAEDDDLYIENEVLPPPADVTFDDGEGALPPPPPDILPPPPPPDDDEEDLYADVMMPDITPDDDNIYSDNIIGSNDMEEPLYEDLTTIKSDTVANAHTVSVSKDSGFYAMEPEDDDPVIEKVRVIYPYAATASDELNLNPGDVVSVHVKNPDGWYEGTLNGIRGLFPGNYVETVE